MTYPPVPVTPVREYMLYFAAAENDLLDGNYAAALALYIIDVAALTAAPALSDVSRQIFSTSSNASIAFLLWLVTPGVTYNV